MAVVSGAVLSGPAPAHRPQALLLRGDLLYYSTGAEVASIPIAGGAPTVTVSGQKNVVALVADEQRMFGAATGLLFSATPVPADGQIVSIPFAGGAPTVLASGQREPSAIAIDADTVYWTAGGVSITGGAEPIMDGQVLALPKAGGRPATVLAQNLLHPGPIAVGGGWIVFAAYGGGTSGEITSVLSAVRREGGSVVTLASADRLISAVATDGTTVFWTESDSPSVDVSNNDGRVRAVSLAGGAVTTLADAQPEPGFLTLLDDQIYWANAGGFANTTSENSGGVWHLPKDGGTSPISIVSSISYLWAFAASAERVAYVQAVDTFAGSWALLVAMP
jgi:hypothetical protein